MKGKVKFYDEKKACGFIAPDDGSKDVYFQFSAIQFQSGKTLTEGQNVEFDVTSSSKGPQASNVKMV
eukprot:CAMPEP_0170061062 /NCGR_PEP_ID=MMETSP0019_2-20121128/2774_1 /TAXON_ID=98059 /ORGANISM="Dinobryon sp., Strain UTEXLB2267" /LENGTH=66 /DNA_ID=CAMNT_0010266805 /DNA_START=2122 /DNA_END=2322 /DNA_ORIENTATION=+